MVRSFSLRDVALVRRLQSEGTRFDLPEVLIRPRSPLQLALLAHLLHRELGAETCVLDAQRDHHTWRGFAQVRPRRERPEWDVICLAPALEGTANALPIWQVLLEHICTEAGKRGILRLFAKANKNGQAADIFGSLDFHIFTYEDILYCESNKLFKGVRMPELDLANRRPEDGAELHHLYTQATPANVQIAEGHVSLNSGPALTPSMRGTLEREYVLRVDKGVRGYLGLVFGQKGYGLRLVIHPDYRDKSTELLCWGLATLSNYPSRPVYCSVRHYEKEIHSLLQDHEFDVLATQALLVKHLVVRVKEPFLKMAPAKKRVETAPTHTYETYRRGKA